ncbi:hypothetical protein J7E93_01180 [Streptomyces sp. ISL-36]|uniref:hypothetical protein n=1 Tax=Streptomyces sp. ISL-36 TaxID=2819182 RepID=UPI001BEAE697|nr:hypothetical protein [Streptomyces sp. ISL-36]MBT2438759.1 hypothetical protein [Streptomyces sp. ISL-36]
MSYSERWQELFRPQEEAVIVGGARMTLASTASQGGSGTGAGNLKHSGGPWTSASGTSGELRTSTEKSRAALRPGHEGVSAGAAGFASVASLTSVLKSWEDRLAAVRDECDQLEGTLLKVAKEMGETEVAIEKSFKAVDSSGDKAGAK